MVSINTIQYNTIQCILFSIKSYFMNSKRDNQYKTFNDIKIVRLCSVRFIFVGKIIKLLKNIL